MKKLIILLLLLQPIIPSSNSNQVVQQEQQIQVPIETYYVFNYWTGPVFQLLKKRYNEIGRYLEIRIVIQGSSSEFAHELANAKGDGIVSVKDLKKTHPHISFNLIKVPEPFLTFYYTNRPPMNYYLYVHKNNSNYIEPLIEAIRATGPPIRRKRSNKK